MDEEAYERDSDANCEGDDGPRVDSARVVIDAFGVVDGVDVELGFADEEVVGDHDAGDGAEQAGVTDEPADDVGVGRREQLPWAHRQSKQPGDHATGAETNQAREQVGEVVGGRDDVSADVDVERGDEDGDERDECNDGLMECADELDGIPDGMAEENDRGRGAGDSDEGEEGHGNW